MDTKIAALVIILLIISLVISSGNFSKKFENCRYLLVEEKLKKKFNAEGFVRNNKVNHKELFKGCKSLKNKRNRENDK